MLVGEIEEDQRKGEHTKRKEEMMKQSRYNIIGKTYMEKMENYLNKKGEEN